VASGEEARGEPEVQVLVIGASGVLGSAIARRLCEDWAAPSTWDVLLEPQRTHELGCVSKYLDARDQTRLSNWWRKRGLARSRCVRCWWRRLAVRMSASQWRSEMSEPLESLFWTLRAGPEVLAERCARGVLGSRVGEVGGAGQSAYATTRRQVNRW
jgi:NAD(P)-dependent dehydrogenase (short-subunit alcohol dehydrogenase family)